MEIRGDLRVRSTGGVSIEVHDLGGSGEPLLVCHATGFCGRAYEPLAAELAADFHVWAIDFRGHGWSDAPSDADYSWDRMAEDVRAAARSIGPDGVRVVGHSMGGAAALLAETRWPGTVTAAYLFEPAVLRTPDQEGPAEMMRDQALRRSAVFATRAGARVRLLQRPTYATWSTESFEAFLQHGFVDLPDGRVQLRCAPESEALCYVSGATCISDVAGVPIPVTVAAGLGPDLFGAARSARALAEAIPQARLAEHAGLSHFGPFEDPVAIAGAARAALI